MYDVNLADIEKNWEEYFMLPAFRKAVEFLKNHGVIKSDSDIARKLHLSKSIVSQYLSADRPLTRPFVEKFERAYKITLQDVATYMDISWADKLIENKHAVVKPDAYMASYIFFKKMIHARDCVIEGQRKVIEGMTLTNEMLMSVYITQELKILNQVIGGSHYAKEIGKAGKKKNDPATHT